MNPAFVAGAAHRDPRCHDCSACSWNARQRRIAVNYAKRQVGRRMYAGQSSASAVQAQHVGRDPADLRLEPAAVPGHDRELLRHQRYALGCAARLQQRRRRPSATDSPCTWCSTRRSSSSSASSTRRWCSTRARPPTTSRSPVPSFPASARASRPREYIDKVLTRLTLWGALYVMRGVPAARDARFPVRQRAVPVRRHLALLIVVVVVMDFMAQLQAHLMSHQYEGLMKKANLRVMAQSRVTDWNWSSASESHVHQSRRSARTARSCAVAAWSTSSAAAIRGTSSGKVEREEQQSWHASPASTFR